MHKFQFQKIEIKRYKIYSFKQLKRGQQGLTVQPQWGLMDSANHNALFAPHSGAHGGGAFRDFPFPSHPTQSNPRIASFLLFVLVFCPRTCNNRTTTTEPVRLHKPQILILSILCIFGLFACFIFCPQTAKPYFVVNPLCIYSQSYPR